MTRRELTADEVDAICQQYRAGEGTKSLAKAYGRHYRTIVSVLKRNGVELRGAGRPRSRFFSQDDVDEMAQLWRDGLSQTAISKKYGTTQVIVSRVLRQNGIEPTTRWVNRRGEQHASWKGGRVTTNQGYTLVLVPPDSPYASMRTMTGYVPEHRLVVAESLGRPLTSAETVHHINGDRSDNRIENLQLRSGRHGNGATFRCLDCGSRNVEAVPLD